MDEMSQESSDPEGLTFSRLGKNWSEPCNMYPYASTTTCFKNY